MIPVSQGVVKNVTVTPGPVSNPDEVSAPRTLFKGNLKTITIEAGFWIIAKFRNDANPAKPLIPVRYTFKRPNEQVEKLYPDRHGASMLFEFKENGDRVERFVIGENPDDQYNCSMPASEIPNQEDAAIYKEIVYSCQPWEDPYKTRKAIPTKVVDASPAPAQKMAESALASAPVPTLVRPDTVNKEVRERIEDWKNSWISRAHEGSSKSEEGAASGKPDNAVSAQLLRTLLLLLADPYSMKPAELGAADRLIADSLHDMLLGSSWTNGSVAFNLETGTPLASWKAEINPRKRVVWVPVSQAVANMQANAGASRRFSSPDLPRVLARRWAAFPSHRHALRTDAFISSSFICGAISLTQTAKASMQYGHDRRIKHGVRAGILLDHSDTGCRIRLRRANYLNLTPGVLVGFELPSMRGLSAGVVRWVKHSSELHTEAGICFVAREFEPVPLLLSDGRWEGGNLVEFGLLAVGALGSLDKDSVEIILPRNKVPAEGVKVLKAVNTGGDFYVQDVLEVGHDFLRISARTQASQSWTAMELAPFSI